MMPTADMVQEGVLQPMQMIFTGGAAHIQGLNLILNDTTVRHYPANIELVPESGYAFELPEDLLAVLGRDWGLLRRRRAGWIGSVRARGSTFDRSRQIETKLERLVAHLTATFARPPAQFHETRVKARWAVAFRRAAPLLSFVALIAGAGSLSFIRIPDGSILRLLIMGTPTMLLFGAFTMREWPAIEFPTFPRRPKTTEWHQPRALPQVR
ncbi:MAG: hypothetical protein ACJ8AW_30465 [Rhodopila sp.]